MQWKHKRGCDAPMEIFASIVARVYEVSLVSLNEKDLIVSLLEDHKHCYANRAQALPCKKCKHGCETRRSIRALKERHKFDYSSKGASIAAWK